MKTIRSPKELQEIVSEEKTKGQRIALVPTMGALHEGHLSLVRKAKERTEFVITSIFVNPLQFSPTEDLARYPRPFEKDSEALKKEGVSILFAPTESDFYPNHFQTQVKVSKISEFLCGKSRTGHFDGVATVCLKLFLSSRADFAIFGEKDFQQLRVLEQMVSDVNLGSEIVRHPTVREPDGLALSSRNQYLSPPEREQAALISKSLRWSGDQPKSVTIESLKQGIAKIWKGSSLKADYIEVASEETLVPGAPLQTLDQILKPRLFVAAFLGSTRLIDNWQL